MGVLQQVGVTNTPQRIQTWLNDTGQFLLVNPDITNQIFIGNDQSTQPIAVPPLGSVTLDSSKHDTWVSARVAVNAYLMPGGTNWTPSPAQVAAQIQTLGLATETTQQSVSSTMSNMDFSLAFGTNGYLAGTSPGALVSQAGIAVAEDMLHAHTGVTAEIAALLATGAANGQPGGIPLLRHTTQLGSNVSPGITVPVLGSGNAVLVNSVTVNQPSFETILSLELPSATGTIPFCIITVLWLDSVTGLGTDTEQYIIAAGNGSGLSAYLSGPCRGDMVSISAANLDPAIPMTLEYIVNATSHVYTHDRLLQPAYSNAPIGFTNPNGSPANGLIAIANPSIGAGATSSRLLAAYNGKARINFDALGQTNAYTVTLQDPGSLYSGTANGNFYANTTPSSGGRFYDEVQMPNGPVLLTVKNSGAAAGAPTVSVFKEEY